MTRAATVRQSDAQRLLKAGKAAGWARVRLIVHTDSTIEIIGEQLPPSPADDKAGTDWDEVLKK